MHNNDDINKKDQLKPSEVELLDEMYRMAKRKRGYTKAEAIDLLDVRQAKLQKVMKKAWRSGHPMAVVFTDYTPAGERNKTGYFYLVAADELTTDQFDGYFSHQLKIYDGSDATRDAQVAHPVVNKLMPGVYEFNQARKEEWEAKAIICDPKADDFKRQQAEVVHKQAIRKQASIVKKNPAVQRMARVVLV